MDYLRQIEDDLRNLANEAKRKYPEVRDATDRALSSLRTIREVYVADMMKKDPQRSVKLPMSSDLTAPYILICNYADASPKLISMALGGIHLLLNYETVPPNDVKNILRVLNIQSGSNKGEFHLKLLQISLQLINLLSQDSTSIQYLTDNTACGLLSLSIQLCDSRSSVSVSSTALATVRQIISVIMENTERSAFSGSLQVDENSSAQLLFKDLVLFASALPSEWLRGVNLPQQNALDLLFDVLMGWKRLFRECTAFQKLLKDKLIPCIKSLLRNVQEDFIYNTTKIGIASSSAFTSRIIRLARCLLLNFFDLDIVNDGDLIFTFLIHTLQPDRVEGNSYRINAQSNSLNLEETLRAKLDEATMIFTSGGAGAFISKLALPGLPPTPKSNAGVSSSSMRSQINIQGAFLTMINTGPTSLTPAFSSGSILAGTSNNASQIPAHPAGASLEVLLSFFLSDFSGLMKSNSGLKFLASSFTNTIISVCNLITGAFGVESNCKDFDTIIQSSQLTALLEGVLSGTETDVEYVTRSVNELLLSSATISSSEVMVLGFELLQVCVRLLTILVLEDSSFKLNSDLPVHFFSSPLILETYPRKKSTFVLDSSQVRAFVSSIFENTYEAIQDACLNLLTRIDFAIVVRRSLGILSEAAFCCGVCELNRASNSLVTSLCKLTVPQWHGHEMQFLDSGLPADSLRWRHIQAIVRLVQLTHVLADAMTDWDTVIDSFDQLYSAFGSKMTLSEDIMIVDIDKIFTCFDRFKHYSLYLSDDSLVKLMSSLVALSLNNLGTSASSSANSSKALTASSSSTGVSSSASASVQPISASVQGNKFAHAAKVPQYMVECLNQGLVGFSLHAVVEITKVNRHRVSCIWQMVTSHFRMIASQKSPKLRALAVAATHDIIAVSLSYMFKPVMPPPNLEFIDSEDLPGHLHERCSVILSDEVLFNWILPSFESAFIPRVYHRNILIERALSPSKNNDAKLVQGDLIASLRSLTSVRYEDVKNDVINGLLLMLQNDGQLLTGAWSSVVEILSSVPSSMINESASLMGDAEESASSRPSQDLNEDSIHWSKFALSESFNCVKLIVDDFLELLKIEDIESMIRCLSIFGSQTQDVNISLTSLEMLWKVTDLSITSANLAGNLSVTENVLSIMLDCLQKLSMDNRPEIRHCALNTLFGAIGVNAPRLTISRWKSIFQDILIPLFQRAGERAALALKRNEEAFTPELKKGVKMAMHHSRDTAQKQWAETQVLVLKGLSRVLKCCTKLLLREEWFKPTWRAVSEIYKHSLDFGRSDKEVSLAGIDGLFLMLKFVSISSEIKSSRDSLEEFAAIEGIREVLWNISWGALQEAAFIDIQTTDVAYHFCQSLVAFYNSNRDAEFRYSENVRVFLGIVTMLARPRYSVAAAEASSGSSGKSALNVSEVQLHRAILDVLRKFSHPDPMSLTTLASAIFEICFSIQYSRVCGAYSSREVILAPCGVKLRKEAGDIAFELLSEVETGVSGAVAASSSSSSFSSSSSSNEAQGLQVGKNAHSILDVLLRKFIDKVFSRAIELRGKSSQSIAHSSPNSEKAPAHHPDTLYSNLYSTFRQFVSPGESTKRKPNEPEDDLDKQGTSTPAALQSFNNFSLHSIPLMSIPAPKPASMNADAATANIESTTVTATTTDCEFYPINFPTELAMIAKSVQSCLGSAESFNKMSFVTWQSLTCICSCILSPWRPSEIFVNPIDESLKESSATISELVSFVFAKCSEYRLKPDWFALFIDAVVSASRLLIIGVAKTLENGQVSAVVKGHVSRFIVDVISPIQQSLEQLVQTSASTEDVQFVAASKGLLILSADLANYGLMLTSVVPEDESCPILDLCASFIKSLIPVETFPEIVLNFQLPKLPAQFSAVTHDWLLPFRTLKSVEKPSQFNSAPVSPAREPLCAQSFLSKTHLLLLLPLLLRLACSSTGAARDIAIQAIDAIKVNDFAHTLADNAAEISELKRINKELRAEITAVKSAASLPF